MSESASGRSAGRLSAGGGCSARRTGACAEPRGAGAGRAGAPEGGDGAFGGTRAGRGGALACGGGGGGRRGEGTAEDGGDGAKGRRNPSRASKDAAALTPAGSRLVPLLKPIVLAFVATNGQDHLDIRVRSHKLLPEERSREVNCTLVSASSQHARHAHEVRA